jgi:uncharacterized membrane protein YeiH
VFAVAERRLDWFGAIVVGVVTAVGGGTMRDLFLGQAPVFWIDDTDYLLAATIGAAVAIPLARLLADESAERFESQLQLADALGLALFTVVGANIALDTGFDAGVAVVAGLITGVGGGVIRDLLADRTPLILGHSEIYATAALAGALVFVGLVEVANAGDHLAGAAGAVTILGLRVAAIRRGWTLPLLGRAG